MIFSSVCARPRISRLPVSKAFNIPISTSISKFHVCRSGDDAIVLTQDERGDWSEQSRTNLATARAKHEYARRILESVYEMPSKKMLILGCGGASIPHEMIYHHGHVNMTVVDNAKEALEVGRYLVNARPRTVCANTNKEEDNHTNPNNVDWVLADAFEYVRDTSIKYDIILTDIFDVTTGRIPDWTAMPCFLHYICEKLTDSGTYIQNIIADDFREHMSSLSTRFEYVKAYPCPSVIRNKDVVRNVVFWCRPDKGKGLFTQLYE